MSTMHDHKIDSIFIQIILQFVQLSRCDTIEYTEFLHEGYSISNKHVQKKKH